MKDLGRNPTKYVEHLHIESSKALMSNIKEDLSKWRNYSLNIIINSPQIYPKRQCKSKSQQDIL